MFILANYIKYDGRYVIICETNEYSMSEPLRIIYASDDNYAGLTAVSAVSLLKHNPGAHIHLLGCNLKPESIDVIKSRVERHGGTFTYLDASPAINRLKAIGANSYVSYAVYARIFIPDLMPNETGKVLYLDCDTLVAGSLDELFATDLHGHPLALAPDVIHPRYKKVISLPANRPYYNTGVLLMDLAAWRTARCSERLTEELLHPHGINPLGDQDIIVRTLNSEIEPLAPRWNFLSQYFLLRRKDRPAIYHFSGNTLGRPWFTSSRHPLRETYRQAAAEAGLPEVTEQHRPLSLEYKIQYWLYRLLPPALFKPICNLMYRAHIRLTYGI